MGRTFKKPVARVGCRSNSLKCGIFFINFFGGQIEEYLMIIKFLPTHFRVENLMVKFIFPEKNYFDIFGTKHTFLNVSFFGLKSN